MSQNLQEFARRAEETDQLASKLQAQLDYLSSRLKLASVTGQSGVTKGSDPKLSNQLSTDQIEDLLLEYIDDHKSADSRDFGNEYDLTANEVYGAINSLWGSEYITQETKSISKIGLTKEAKSIIELGSPEYRLYQFIPENGMISKNELQEKLDKNIFKIGLGKCMANKWIQINKTDNTIIRNSDLNGQVTDLVRQQLRNINLNGESAVSPNDLKILKKRKLLNTQTHKYFILNPGPKFSRKRVKPIAEITMDHIKDHIDDTTGNWTGPPLKEYNFNALGQKAEIGALHPLMKMRHEMRNILLEMGFEEMSTNNYVESSFWNFDALFQPQQHPARDAHDTFFLSKPSIAKIEYNEYMSRVKKTHSQGGFGSIGWRYDWKESEAKKNLLRTHTTAVSSRTLYKLAQLTPFKPTKCFSIDRVFRNEAIDSTHLAEFHQVEGFIADYDLTLGHLIGVIGEFFKKIGITDVRFKPAYNPYTEPSMEIFGYSEERNDYVEVGNSGIFRPEMLEPMGLPKDVTVIAWGLGLERDCMISTGVADIRQLFGPRVDVNMVKKSPFVRYDKH